jgi:hypothetical protein
MAKSTRTKRRIKRWAPALYPGFLDLQYARGDCREEGNDLVATFHREGTLAHDLDPSSLGMGVVKATSRKIICPEFEARLTVRNDQIAGIQEITA